MEEPNEVITRRKNPSRRCHWLKRSERVSSTSGKHATRPDKRAAKQLLKEKFPNFFSLTNDERALFRDTLLAARKTIEKRENIRLGKLGTIHDELLKSHRSDASFPSGNESGDAEEIIFDNGRSPCLVPSEESRTTVKPKKRHRPFSLSRHTHAKKKKVSDGEYRQSDAGFSKPSVEKQFRKVTTGTSRDKRKYRSGSVSARSGKYQSNRSKQPKKAERKEFSEDDAETSDKGGIFKAPKFGALSAEEKTIFFQTLKTAYANIIEKDPKKKADIIGFADVVKMYDFAEGSDSVTLKQNEKDVGVQLKVTVTSHDNERLKKFVGKTGSISTVEDGGMSSASKTHSALPSEQSMSGRSTSGDEENLNKLKTPDTTDTTERSHVGSEASTGGSTKSTTGGSTGLNEGEEIVFDQSGLQDKEKTNKASVPSTSSKSKNKEPIKVETATTETPTTTEGEYEQEKTTENKGRKIMDETCSECERSHRGPTKGEYSTETGKNSYTEPETSATEGKGTDIDTRTSEETARASDPKGDIKFGKDKGKEPIVFSDEENELRKKGGRQSAIQPSGPYSDVLPTAAATPENDQPRTHPVEEEPQTPPGKKSASFQSEPPSKNLSTSGMKKQKGISKDMDKTREPLTESINYKEWDDLLEKSLNSSDTKIKTYMDIGDTSASPNKEKESKASVSAEGKDKGRRRSDEVEDNLDYRPHITTKSVSELSGAQSEFGERDSEIVMESVKKVILPRTKIRTLQDLLKDRAVFEKTSTDNFVVKYIDSNVLPEKIGDETGSVPLLDMIDEEQKVKKKRRWLIILEKILTCGRKETDEVDAIVENLKGESVPIEMEEKGRTAANATLDPATRKVLQAAKRKRILAQYTRSKPS